VSDLDKGAKWRQIISGELRDSDFGIVCLTPENLESPWLLFEAGALSKKEDSHVCTYLFDVQNESVKDPLSQFQHTLADEKETFDLLKTMNRTLGSKGLGENHLQETFQVWWPKLKKKLEEVPPPGPKEVSTERSERDMISEILTRGREMERLMKPTTDREAPTPSGPFSQQLFEYQSAFKTIQDLAKPLSLGDLLRPQFRSAGGAKKEE